MSKLKAIFLLKTGKISEHWGSWFIGIIILVSVQFILYVDSIRESIATKIQNDKFDKEQSEKFTVTITQILIYKNSYRIGFGFIGLYGLKLKVGSFIYRVFSASITLPSSGQAITCLLPV